jgi:hypothetical protein
LENNLQHVCAVINKQKPNKKSKENSMKLDIEKLEARIAPGDCCYSCEPPKEKCNNGWGNGENCAPGNSLANQPKFEDPNTGASPSNSAASGGGDR